MIPTIATYLAIAASFWGQPVGTTSSSQVEVTFNHTICGPTTSFANVPACATPGHIYINPELWFPAARVEKCTIILHEYGHAVFGLPHKSHTVMATPITTAEDYAPLACVSPPLYNHRIDFDWLRSEHPHGPYSS